MAVTTYLMQKLSINIRVSSTDPNRPGCHMSISHTRSFTEAK